MVYYACVCNAFTKWMWKTGGVNRSGYGGIQYRGTGTCYDRSIGNSGTERCKNWRYCADGNLRTGRRCRDRGPNLLGCAG